MNKLGVISTMVLSLGLFGVVVWYSWQSYVHQPTEQSAVLDPNVNTADPVLVAVGDIASCGLTGDSATAALLDTIDGTIVTLGDNAYEDGTQQEFAECFDPVWGRHRDRIRPSPGNHDYQTEGAAGYFHYFGEAAGADRQGYYQFELGEWSVVSLNSNCSAVGGCDAGSAQYQWLANTLDATSTKCAVAYMHHPPFSSGFHGDTASMRELWSLMVNQGVDLVLAGHDHHYERFAPLNQAGEPDLRSGTRTFVVGTGGASLRPIPTIRTGSEIRISDDYGVLKLWLHPASYSWQFVNTGGVVRDEGLYPCT